MTQALEYESETVTELDISHLVIEDDTPVDNLQSEKQQRLLVESLYSSKALPLPFLAAANVGLFYSIKQDAVVPDVFLSLGVEVLDDWSKKESRSYFVWEFGKVPDICIEIVSNQEGNELTVNSAKSKRKLREGIPQFSKLDIYAQIGIPYYAVFDPFRQIPDPNQMNGSLLKVWGLSRKHYEELPDPYWLEEIGLGLTLWEGKYEDDKTRLWLRWCDRAGRVIPTGAERADRLAERLQALGIDPDEV